MIIDVPFAELRAFIKRQRVLGNYKANTAAARDAACKRIESILKPEENSIAYVQSHLDELLQRYGTQNRGEVSPTSLLAYRGRIAKAIQDFTAAQTDPNWKPTAQRSWMVPQPDLLFHTGRAYVVTEAKDSYGATASTLRHRLPLRPDFDVEILLPRDFTEKEAKRVTAWIATLATT